MVREREAPSSAQPQGLPATNPREPLQETAKPRQIHDLTASSPEFGKTSPIRNPLHRVLNKAEASLFNVPKKGARPEHHRDGPFSQSRNVSGASTSSQGSNSQGSLRIPPPFDAAPLPQPTGAFRVPPLVSSSQPQYKSVHAPDVYEIPRPTIFQPKNTYAPPQPTFSSFGGFNTAPAYPPTKPVNFAQGDSDFNPDAALQSTRFGDPDPYRYVDSSKANEDIKALLEGAFDDDDDDKPQLPRMKRQKKKQEEVPNAMKSLADRLQSLDVKKEEPEEEEDGEDEEDGSLEGLAVKLLPHQVEGVAWMNDREISQKKKNGVIPNGGILADDMGLGKTIQTLALMLTNPLPSKEEREKDKKNKIPANCSKTTLVIAPLALIKQWEAEIKTRVTSSHRMKVLVHHGPSRTKRFDELKKYDVVITTYQIIASEHANSSDSDDGIKTGCFGVYWYRIILDEAHSIKNRNAKSTKACYALRSHYRWCLTGTPMQNNLDELQSLIQFLKIRPYCDIGPWKEQITGPMKNGRGGLAMRRLQFFLKSCMKRRTKDVLKKDGALNPGGKVKEGEKGNGFRIVDRKVETITAEFNPQERAFYDRLADRAQSRLDEMMGAAKNDYIGALVLLLRLRQACNHPQLIGSNMKKDNDALTTGASKAGTQTPKDDMDDIANLLGGLSVESKKCDVCQQSLTQPEIASSAVRCADCEADFSSIQPKKEKKERKHKKSRKEKLKKKSQSQPQPKPVRQRKVILDSDDEEEGDWVVPEEEREVSSLGRAGGTDDENAEGPGEWLNSDQDSATEDEEQEEGNRARKLKQRAVPLDSDEEEQDSDSEISSDEETDSEDDSSSDESDVVPDRPDMAKSTKIRYLMEILEKDTPEHKVIVFSQFTSMLDLVEPFLRSGGYNFTRYDGSMKNDHREASLEKLRNDKKTRVLLCSLKCGSLGLNLTAASRVVILEPFWNPVGSLFIVASTLLTIFVVCRRTSHRPSPSSKPNSRRSSLPSHNRRHSRRTNPRSPRSKAQAC
jgi:SNF2 family DNA or RNA helicase